MYSLLMCLSLFSMWLFARYFQKGKSLIALTIVNVVLVWTHYFGWFVIASEVAAVLVFQRIKWRPILTMCGVAVGAFIPWAVSIFLATKDGSGLSQNIGWMQRPGVLEAVKFKLALVEPFYSQASNADPTSIYKVSIPLLIIVSIAVIAFVVGWRHRTIDEKRSVGFLFLFAGVPLTAAFIGSWMLPYSIWGTRHLIIAFPPTLLLIAISLAKLPAANLRVSLITLQLLLISYAAVVYAFQLPPKHIWCEFEAAANEINKFGSTKVYVFEDLAAYHLWFALRNSEKQIDISRIDNVNGMTEDPAYFLPRGFDDVTRRNIPSVTDDSVWIVYRSREFDYTTLPPLKGFDEAGYEINEVETFPAGDWAVYAVRLVKRDLSRPQVRLDEAARGLAGDCWKPNPERCFDLTDALIDLYHQGDKTALDLLLDGGLKADGALAEEMGVFYGEVLSAKPVEFLSHLGKRPRNEQEQLCFLAVAADGSGNPEPWEINVKASLNKQRSGANENLRQTAQVCLDQLEKFHNVRDGK
jgi:hypothetical protein